MDAHNAAFTILGHSVYWYGIVIGLGVLAALFCAYAREGNLGLPKDTTLNLALIMLPVGLISARLYYVAFTWENYAANPAQIFNIRAGGMAIYGALIGGALALIVYARAVRKPFLLFADLLAPALALAQGIGRWGNFFNQEAYGIAVTDPRLQFFPVAVYIGAEGGFHCATFFYESLWCILAGLLILVLERRGRLRRTGDAFLLYVMLYAFERALVEGLRTDSLYLGALRVSQTLSILALCAVCLLQLVRLLRAGRKFNALLSMALWGLLLLAMLLSSVLGLRALPYLLFFCVAQLVLSVLTYRQLPGEDPAGTHNT